MMALNKLDSSILAAIRIGMKHIHRVTGKNNFAFARAIAFAALLFTLGSPLIIIAGSGQSILFLGMAFLLVLLAPGEWRWFYSIMEKSRHLEEAAARQSRNIGAMTRIPEEWRKRRISYVIYYPPLISLGIFLLQLLPGAYFWPALGCLWLAVGYFLEGLAMYCIDCELPPRRRFRIKDRVRSLNILPGKRVLVPVPVAVRRY